MEQEVEYDENLWFNHKGCEGKHFLIGNPHTFFGRMWAWCPAKKITFFVSKSEIEDVSEQARYWIKGFLTGNQPEPPRDHNGDVNFASLDYKEWLEKIKVFEESGEWESSFGML